MIDGQGRDCWLLRGSVAPAVGFEPTTKRPGQCDVLACLGGRPYVLVLVAHLESETLRGRRGDVLGLTPLTPTLRGPCHVAPIRSASTKPAASPRATAADGSRKPRGGAQPGKSRRHLAGCRRTGSTRRSASCGSLSGARRHLAWEGPGPSKRRTRCDFSPSAAGPRRWTLPCTRRGVTERARRLR